MSMVVKVLGAEEILRAVLDPWRDGIDAHDPDRVAGVFTDDAIFQGCGRTASGRRGCSSTTTRSRPA